MPVVSRRPSVAIESTLVMAPKVSVDVIGESGDASLGFTQLPDEILVDIMGYLDVSDVFTIRATCHQLEILSRDCIYWLRAYHHLRLSLPSPPHPPAASVPSSMESTTAHMLRLAKNWASPTPMPTRKRTFTWNTSPGSSLWFSDLELLPGGKWALTLTGDGLRVRNLNGEVIEDGVLIARHPGRDVLGQDMVVDTRDMPRSCAVADYCASRHGDDCKREVTIWRINFESSSACIAKLTSFEVMFALSAMSLRGDLLAFVPAEQNAPLIIMDWRNSRKDTFLMTSFSDARADEDWHPELVRLLPNSRILSLHKFELKLYEIPPFKPIATMTDLNPDQSPLLDEASSTPTVLWSFDITAHCNVPPQPHDLSDVRIVEYPTADVPMHDTSCLFSLQTKRCQYRFRIPRAGMPHVMDATPLPAGTNFVGRELGLWRGFTIDDAYNLVLLSNNKPICRGPCSDRALAEGDEGVIGRAAYDVGCLKLRMAVLDEGSGRVCFLAAPASGNKLASYEEDLIHVWDFI